MSKKLALIIGSTRGIRAGLDVTAYVQKVFATSTSKVEATIEVIDLKTWDLPIYNEEIAPMMIAYGMSFKYEYSKKWTEFIKAFDGYIVVTPEYNACIPGGLKNALDYIPPVYVAAKPSLTISYGVQGGASANGILKTVLETLKMSVVETRPQLKFAGPGMDESSIAATTGKIGVKTMESWEAEKEGLLKGYGELLDALVTLPETVAPAA